MIFVAWHLGLGDAIACAAIVAKLAKTEDRVVIPCWSHNKVSVKSLFVDYPNVVVRSDSDRGTFEGECKTMALGHYNKDMPQLQGKDFVEWFYRQAGMDISEKEKYCPVKKAAEKEGQFNTVHIYGDKILHEDKERGFIINLPGMGRMRNVYEITKTDKSILRYSEILSNYKEVHCIDSSFLHLAEALNVSGKKFYHKYARPESTDYNYLKNWNVLN